MSSTLETPTTLSPEEGQTLVQLARATIADRLGSPLPEDKRHALTLRLQNPVFAKPGGAFVTLTLDGCLRGCIGALTSQEPLPDTVRANAVNAAFRDPRFPSLTWEEFGRIAIEISVLSPPQPLAYGDADELVMRLRSGIDGLILRKGGASATFLPQVWKQLPRTRDFLSHLCLKAGLPAHAWQEGNLQVETYRVQSFEEGPVD